MDVLRAPARVSAKLYVAGHPPCSLQSQTVGGGGGGGEFPLLLMRFLFTATIKRNMEVRDLPMSGF